MNRLSVLALSIASLSSLVFIPSPNVFAQDAADLEMEKFQFSGVLNADNVYVRSGSSENDYPVMKLSKGDTVVVVGHKADWLKILPPEGSFCLVNKAWVDQRGDGSVGRVRDEAPNVVVRIGSNLNNMIQKVAVKLNGGDDVRIVGEQDEYFKIVPPAGTVMFVHKKFIDPLKRVEVVNNNGQVEVRGIETPTASANQVPAPANNVTPPAQPTIAMNDNGTDEAAPVEANNQSPAPEAATAEAPATQPAADVAADFDALEKRFNDATALPIEQQPIGELLAGYEKVVAEKKVPESMLRIAEFRIKGLKVRQEALRDFVEVQKTREEVAAKLQPIEAEAREVEQRIEQAQVKRVDAVGTLRASAITINGRPLYRLTDPQSGHTVVYLQTNDPAVIRNEGMFVAVRGKVTEDPVRRITIIQPESAEQILPTAVTNGEVVSRMVPPSMVPAVSTAAQR